MVIRFFFCIAHWVTSWLVRVIGSFFETLGMASDTMILCYEITMTLYGAFINKMKWFFMVHWLLKNLIVRSWFWRNSIAWSRLLRNSCFQRAATCDVRPLATCGHLQRAATCNVRPLATCGHLQRAAACGRHAMAVDTHSYVVKILNKWAFYSIHHTQRL